MTPLEEVLLHSEVADVVDKVMKVRRESLQRLGFQPVCLRRPVDLLTPRRSSERLDQTAPTVHFNLKLYFNALFGCGEREARSLRRWALAAVLL